MRKRIIAALLALVLSAGLVFTASAESFVNSESYLRTSYDSGSYLVYSIAGSTLSVSGRLTVDGLSSVMARIGENCVYADVGSSEDFSLSLSLFGVTEPVAADVYTHLDSKSVYWSIVWNRIYVEKSGEGWRIIPSTVLNTNLAFTDEWLNPADYLSDSVSDEIRALSDEITAGIVGDRAKVFAIYKWVVANIYYDYDAYYQGGKTFYDAVNILANRRSVCAGYASILKELILAQGIPCMETDTYALGVNTDGGSFAVSTDNSDAARSNHAHVEAFVDGSWMVLDSTWDSQNRFENGQFVSEMPNGYYYFDSTPEAFAMDHKLLSRGDGTLSIRDGAVISRNTVESGKKPSDWAVPEAKAALSAGLIPYALQNNYTGEISRSDFCKLMMNMLRVREGMANNASLLKAHGLELTSGLFTDTADEDVCSANLLGIVNGVGGGLFDPARSITRQEAAAMLTRAASVTGASPSGVAVSFDDIDLADGWARESILTVASLISEDGSTVMGGTGGGKFSPKEHYTVEQSILTVYRLFRCV